MTLPLSKTRGNLESCSEFRLDAKNGWETVLERWKSTVKWRKMWRNYLGMNWKTKERWKEERGGVRKQICRRSSGSDNEAGFLFPS